MNSKTTGWLLAALMMLVLGFLLGRTLNLDSGMAPGAVEKVSSDAETEPEILYWVAPMDPDYRRDGPGKSPMGMDLVPVYAERQDGDVEDGVYVSPSVKHNLGVRTNQVSVRPLWRRVNATGFVSFDEDLLSRLHMRTSGWRKTCEWRPSANESARGRCCSSFTHLKS